MSLHHERSLEDEICAHLAAHGWIHTGTDATGYDRALALHPEDLLAWVKTAQTTAWDALEKAHGARARDVLIARVRDQLNQFGTLHVLRQGVEILGLRAPVKLAQFRPALLDNPDIVTRYGQNLLRVARQVRYSLANENSLDLVLFLNGVPVATAELKTDFTQSVGDAIDQYKHDRVPQPKGQNPEALLSTPQGALVHFAVSNREVHITTRLAGAATVFLPFNQGDHGGAGNPENPRAGHRTSYLWEEVWARDGWMEILGRYLVPVQDKARKRTERVVFPRYHQLDVTRRLQAAVLRDAPGTRYLVQHSAGSGKTNSIAWTAHFLAELHNAQGRKVFDTVLVISDRTVIDAQLQETLFAFERTHGVVATIKGEDQSKSGELATALSGAKKIVVCTLQTFPFALAEVRRLAAAKGKRFAVIADEAHSSQTGESASKLKEMLSPEELAALKDGGEVSTEDVLAAQMSARADDGGVTFVAFTATPKAKTLELFGTRPDPTRKPAKDNIPAAFHVYSMRQAIEEGFILDVLKNYTPYSVAFKLAHEGKELDEAEVERSAAMKRIMGWVKLHPYNIAQKVEIVVEHFRAHVAPLLGGAAKAMVVVSSRLDAVRWKLAMEKYIASRGYKIGALVAFSGEVLDEDSSPDALTEHSRLLNPTLNGRDIREAFKGGEFQVLLVANKFQTGFDQPLLCGMYVDKRLAGIQAVQTLSRLNRAHPGKDTTYIVDFTNEPDEILAAFKTYYETAELATTTDQHLVYDLRARLDATGYYDGYEVERVAKVELDPRSTQGDLVRALEPVADRLLRRHRAARATLDEATARGSHDEAKAAREEIEALQKFRGDLGTYVRLYTYLSQIFDYGSTEIEMRAIFYKRLAPLLEFGRERDSIDLSTLVLTHYAARAKTAPPMMLRDGGATKLEPVTAAGSGNVNERERVALREVVEKLNTVFGGDLTDGDQLSYVKTLLAKLMESSRLATQAANNLKEQFAASPDLHNELVDAVIGSFDAHGAMSKQMLSSKEVQSSVLALLLDHFGLWEALREKAA